MGEICMEAFRKNAGQFRKYLPLLREMIKRDFRMKYKRSYLGILWTLLDPLLHMLVILLVFSQLFARDIQYFAAYVLTGRIIFQFFSQATNFCLGSVTGGKLYVTSVKMPLFMLPLSKTVSALINESLALICLLFVLVITRVELHVTALLFPIPLFYIFIFSFGFGMALASWNVFFHDTQHLYGAFSTLLWFATPIFWHIDIIPENLIWLIKLNPAYHFVTMFRAMVINGQMPDFSDHLICITFCAAALIIGTTVFNKTKNRFILHL
jgi:ABC-type polysaccharide/polyol phosphate export permease